jgi:hypothetical protein
LFYLTLIVYVYNGITFPDIIKTAECSGSEYTKEEWSRLGIDSVRHYFDPRYNSLPRDAAEEERLLAEFTLVNDAITDPNDYS